jgi:hypothetical protein
MDGRPYDRLDLIRIVQKIENEGDKIKEIYRLIWVKKFRGLLD